MAVNVHEAKTNLSRLLARVAEGEEIVISRAGVPVAKLVPYAQRPRRRLGLLEGQFKVTQAFFEADRDIEEMFYGPEPKKKKKK